MEELVVEKKFTESIDIDNYEVLTDGGYVDIKKIHTTVPYQVYELSLDNGMSLKCADNHIVFKPGFVEVFVKDLNVGDKVLVEDDLEAEVLYVEDLGCKEEMYDLELPEGSDHRYYTSGILSHNTEMVKQLANFMFDSDENIVRLDMSEFSMKHEASKLIGSPPGFVGHDEGGQLTEKIKNKPYSIVLFDELEKADPDVKNSLLQILDEGYLTDSNGVKVDFRNTIIIMTSNIGTSKIIEERALGFTSGSASSRNVEAEVIGELKNHPMTTPEFLNRIDDIVVFNPLAQDSVIEILDIQLGVFTERMLTEKGIKIKVNKPAKKFVAEEGYDKAYGARPLKRAIMNHIENLVSKAIINREISEGDSVTIDMKDGKTVIK